MTAVAFVAPYVLEATRRFVEAAARLPGVELALVTCEPVGNIPVGLRRHLAAHWQITDALDTSQIVGAVQGLSGQLGPIQVLIGILEQLQVPLAEARERLGIAGISVETAHNFRDKSRMKQVMRAAGVPCARHQLADAAEVAVSFAAEVGFPIVVKPPAGAGAKSTFRLDDAADLRVWLQSAPPDPDRVALLEEFLTGEEGSFDSVMIDGQVVWHSISSYIPTPLEVLRNPWIQWLVLMPRDISGAEYVGIGELVPHALRALGLRTGMTHLEWFRRPDGSVAISEVAVRPPGGQITSMLCYAHDLDLYTAWAQLTIFGTFDPPERRWAVGTAFLRGQGAGRIRAVRGLDLLQTEVGSLVVESNLPVPGRLTAGIYEGDGYVIVRHPDTTVVTEALRRIITGVHVELE